MSPDRLKVKEDVSQIDNGPLLSHEKAPLKLHHWPLGRWTLKDHTLSEISQTEEDSSL